MRKLLITLAVVIAVPVVLPALLLGVMFLEHDLPLTLPEPHGPFAVGRVTYAWHELASGRDLVVWIWYPSVPGSARRADYLPAPWRKALEGMQATLMRDFLSRDLSVVRAHSMDDAPLAPRQQRYPVIVMRSGIGAQATDYTTLDEGLASRGYVVVGCDTAGSTGVVVLPDGRVVRRTREGNPSEDLPESEREKIAESLIPLWSGDSSFLVDQLARLNAAGRFAGRLDLGAIGAAGHSFGGATAAQFCHDDARCRAAVDIDGQPFGSVVRDSLRQPFFILLSDHGPHPDRRILGRLHAIYDRIPDGRLFATIAGAHHFSFSDQSLLKSAFLFRILRTVGVIGRLDSRRGLAITTDVVAAWFDVHLKHAPASEIDRVFAAYPELRRE